jgi:hypothetical protein
MFFVAESVFIDCWCGWNGHDLARLQADERVACMLLATATIALWMQRSKL